MNSRCQLANVVRRSSTPSYYPNIIPKLHDLTTKASKREGLLSPNSYTVSTLDLEVLLQ